MARNRYFVSPDGAGQWKCTLNGQVQYTGRTQEIVMAYATERARGDVRRGYLAQVNVQRPNGQFRTEWTYGIDPPEYPG